MNKRTDLSRLRYRGGDRHHLWRKRGVFYCRYCTADDPRYKADRRVCVSLHTTDLAEAIRRRDQLLARGGAVRA